MNPIEILIEFLNTSLTSGQKILDKFANLPGAIHKGTGLEQFVYIPGSRTLGRVLLCAHVDTYWGNEYPKNYQLPDNLFPELVITDKTITSGNSKFGIAADNRAGVALLWLLKDLGVSLLVVNGEEGSKRFDGWPGKIGSRWLMSNFPEIKNEIQQHNFVVEFDNMYKSNHYYDEFIFDGFACYDKINYNFVDYVASTLDLKFDHHKIISSGTDIKELCLDVCGVNLPIGLTDHHTPQETLHLDHWMKLYKKYHAWLSAPNLPVFRR